MTVSKETGLFLKNNIFPGKAGIHHGCAYNEFHPLIDNQNKTEQSCSKGENYAQGYNAYSAE
jgi:hypothetical protein